MGMMSVDPVFLFFLVILMIFFALCNSLLFRLVFLNLVIDVVPALVDDGLID